MTFPVIQSDFARAVRDPASHVPDWVAAQVAPAPGTRFNVYRNNVAVGLREALADRFPVVRRIVGEEFFAAMASVYAAAHPPRSPLMMWYGDDLPTFLAGFKPAAGLEYLPDVARIEVARTRAYHAADAEPLSAAALGAVEESELDGLRLVLHPSLSVIDSTYPVATIWEMHQPGREPGPIADTGAETAAVVRPRARVKVTRLSPGSAAFLAAVDKGQTLAEAGEAAGRADGAFDLSQSLAFVIDEGLATAIGTGEPAT